MTNVGTFKVFEDKFYEEIKDNLAKHVPEFLFDQTDETYLILFEFSGYLIQNISNEEVLKKCCEFINRGINEGGSHTEDAMVTQVFQSIYSKHVYIEGVKEYFDKKTLDLFEKYFEEYLRFYESPS